MKREKRLTKRERKALNPRPARPAPSGGGGGGGQHIHCIACGRHIDAAEFDAPATAVSVSCLHKSTFASCVGCVENTKNLLAEHDRTGQPVRQAAAWH